MLLFYRFTVLVLYLAARLTCMLPALLHSLAKKRNILWGRFRHAGEPKPQLPLAERVARPCASCVCRRADPLLTGDRGRFREDEPKKGGSSRSLSQDATAPPSSDDESSLWRGGGDGGGSPPRHCKVLINFSAASACNQQNCTGNYFFL